MTVQSPTADAARRATLRRRWGSLAPIVVPMLVALAVFRVAAMWYPPLPVIHDALGYTRTAERIVRQGVFAYSTEQPPTVVAPNAIVPPVYPLFLAALYAPGGGTLWAVKAAYPVLKAIQVTMAIAVVGLVAWCGLLLRGRPLAWIAGLMASVYLPFGWAAEVTLTELSGALICVLQLGVALVLARRSEDRRFHRIAWGVFGLTSALVALIRPAFSLWAIVVLAVLLARWWRERPIRQGLVVYAAVFACVMAPWVVRNAITLHRFVPLRTDSGTPMYDATGGGVLKPDEIPIYKQALANGQDGLGAVASYRLRRQWASDPQGLVNMRLSRVVTETAQPWSSVADVYYEQNMHYDRDRIDYVKVFDRHMDPRFVTSLQRTTTYQSWLMIMAIAGSLYAVKWRRLAIVASLPVYAVAVHLPTLFSERYFFPAMPAVIVLAAASITGTAALLAWGFESAARLSRRGASAS